MKHTVVGVDIAKSIIQLHYVDAETGEIVNRPVKRSASTTSGSNGRARPDITHR